jgi:hypothetical protein
VAVAHVADEDRQPAHPRERHPLRPPQPLLGKGEPPDLRAAARDLAAEQRPGGTKPRPPEWIGARRRRPPARVFDSVAFGVFDLSRRWLAGLGRFFAGFSKVSFLPVQSPREKSRKRMLRIGWLGWHWNFKIRGG